MAARPLLNRLLRLRGNRPNFALTADRLSRIHAPTLLVFANDDPMGVAPIGQQMAEAMTDAELHIVDGGHVPWLHHADQIAPLLTTFLQRVSPSDNG
jgi:pimeloyl-ACP methyl ester carboxylesterase